MSRTDARFTVAEVAPSDGRYAEARELRYAILYEPLGLPRGLVDDADGGTFVHLVAQDLHGAVIGYARLRLEGGECQVYQLAVTGPWRGAGVGSALMDAAEGRARAEGRTSVALDARVNALRFYVRRGYVAEGGTFLSARTGTPHRRMRKAL